MGANLSICLRHYWHQIRVIFPCYRRTRIQVIRRHECSRISNTQFIQLPIEILTHIFKNFLDLEDRRNMRLTTHWLNDVCSHSKIIDDEKFVFQPNNTDKNFGRHILECKTMRTSFEFHRLNLRDLQEKHWSHFGSNLQSLLVYNCETTVSMFKNLVIHCPKLKCLNLTDVYYPPSSEERTECLAIQLESALDELLAEKVERQELTSFEMYYYAISQQWSKTICEKIFQIYPRIHTFDGGSRFTWLEFFQYCGKCHRSKMLQSKFEALSINLDINSVTNEKAIIDFFSNQTELKSLKLRVEHPHRCPRITYDKRVIFMLNLLDILGKLPTLEELEFHIPESYLFAREDKINFAKLRKKPFEKFCNLKKLCLFPPLDKGFQDKRLSDLLDKYFDVSLLEHLEISGVLITGNILQKILSIGSLQTLNVTVDLPAAPISNTIPFDNLKKLEHLSLVIQPLFNFEKLLPGVLSAYSGVQFTEFTMEMLFPDELSWKKYEEEMWIQTLDVVSTTLPHIESLCIVLEKLHSSNEILTKLPAYCERLTRLKVLGIDDFRIIPEDFKELVKNLFISCPSLRCIHFSRSRYYSYERISHKLLSPSDENSRYYRNIVKRDPFRPIY